LKIEETRSSDTDNSFHDSANVTKIERSHRLHYFIFLIAAEESPEISRDVLLFCPQHYTKLIGAIGKRSGSILQKLLIQVQGSEVVHFKIPFRFG
jgi:hypothetical protein